MTIHTRHHQLTIEDYLAFPEDGRKREIIEGELFEEPMPPVIYHQRISKHIQFQLYMQLDKTGRGEVLDAPCGVRLTDRDVVEPDLLALAAASLGRVKEKIVDGPPELVVEILSPGSVHHDRVRKAALYARVGVPEYWIVSPEERLLEQHVLTEGHYVLAGRHADRVRCQSLPGVEVDLTQVW